MPINKTYRTRFQRICELRPKQRKTQVQNFLRLLAGIFRGPECVNDLRQLDIRI